MHKFARLSLILAAALLLAACGSDAGTSLPTLAVLPTNAPVESTATSSEPTPTREGDSGPSVQPTAADPGSGVGADSDAITLNGAQFVARLDGAVDEQIIRGDVTLSCAEGGSSLALDSGSTRILFVLPSEAETGIYTLRSDGAENSVGAQIILGPGGVYDSNPDGVLTLSLQGATPSQSLSGSFEFTVGTPEQSINARGLFEVSTSDGLSC